MGKAVQHARTFAKLLDCQSVIFLIQEKAGFLTVLYIYQIFDPVFFYLHIGVKLLADKTLDSFHSFILSYLGVTSFINAPNLNTILS